MRPTSFALHIRPLMRDVDIENMSMWFDLSSYDDVKANSEEILGRLKGATDAVMPPIANDGPWPEEWIALFKRWIDEKHPA